MLPDVSLYQHDITVDVWLYGSLARYGGDANEGSFAHLEVHLPAGSTLADLLAHLGMPTEERGITFISGQLSAMPGLQPDLDHVLRDGDRVGLFDPKSMWPFQYRHGAMMTEEMAAALAAQEDHGLHHTYT
ncbi:MAG: MoaD/ThiS family protein [Chloroflexi bacterium]|nr:MoaD/ThiS family protein [Chloroflexota bacterium]